MWLTSGDICKELNISKATLVNWKRNGTVEVKHVAGTKYLYRLSNSIESHVSNHLNVFYARVSNSKQKNDLEHQIQILKDFMNSSGVVVDMAFHEIASGMNENRIEFNKLLRLVTDKKVKTVYITYKDRFTRFGFDYFKTLFSLFDTEIIVINNTNESDYQQELTEDLISIIHHFSMKMYSHRRKELNNLKQLLINETKI
jgi:putative resolvase